MDKKKIASFKNEFDTIINYNDNEKLEFWYARDLMKKLGYVKWENFEKVIEKAKESCKRSNTEVLEHFLEIRKSIKSGNNTEREFRDYALTRYACYLIAQNGDPQKDEIAFAQSYFALQTRKQELIEERLNYIERADVREKLTLSEKRLSKNIYERGVNELGFARIRSKGDAALFGGKNTSTMKQILSVKDSRSLADFLPTLTIAAKNLATEMTNHNVETNNLKGETDITTEHVENNSTIRKMLVERGIKPEELPPDEDIKKIERRVKKEEKKLVTSSGKLPKLPK